MDPHAGVGETSALLARRPDLVRPGYRRLANNRATTFDEMQTIAKRSGWQGYFSAPALATAAYGRDVEAWWVEGLTDLVLRAIRGENLRGRPRYPGDLAHDPRSPLIGEVLAHERDFERRLDQWLSRHRTP
jgi:hypothetical protein